MQRRCFELALNIPPDLNFQGQSLKLNDDEEAEEGGDLVVRMERS